MSAYKNAFRVNDSLEIHPAALIMPQMSDEEFDAIKVDISGNGLLEPIVLFQGKVLDGRHRYNACDELGIDVWAREWEGGMDPIEYVVSLNIHRRHLTPAQRAMAAAKAMDYHIEEARERQRAAGGDHGNQYTCGKVAVVEAMPQAAINNGVIHCPECGTIHGVKVSCPNSQEHFIQRADRSREMERKKPFASNTQENKAREKAGKMFDVSGRSVAAAKVVLDHGTEEEKKSIENGTASLAPIEKQVRERIKNTATKSFFNRTTDSIEWAKWTWNPVTGCKHECQYCYARDIANRYSDAFPEGFDPTFHPERLEAPANTKLPLSMSEGIRNVFVCSMADLFGDWVPQEWIDQVINVCTNSPDWTFIFLTKNPKRLIGIKWPKNAWVGTTVDCQARVKQAVDAFKRLNEHEYRPVVTFLSCEPMNECLDFGERGLNFFDWVIIGGRSASSGAPAFQPEWEWVESLHNAARAAGCKIYWKPNLKTRPTEYPVD